MTEQRGRRGRQLGLYVPVETADKLKALSAQTDIPQSRLLRQALLLLFEKYSDVLRQKRHRGLKAAIREGADSEDTGSTKEVVARNRARRGTRKAAKRKTANR